MLFSETIESSEDLPLEMGIIKPSAHLRYESLSNSLGVKEFTPRSGE